MPQLSEDIFAFGGPLLSVDEAIALLRERLAPVTEEESVPLAEADGRVLATDIVATRPIPPFANSAVDGYAVRHAELTPDGPTRLPVAGRIAAGHMVGDADGTGDRAARAGPVGRAWRIFTGAPMPPDADTVFMQEDVTLEGDAVILPKGLKRGANARPAGEDVAPGDLALPAGRRLRPQDLALAAALGLTHLPVRRPLRVAVFSTGDELTEPGQPLGPAAIYDSNRIALLSLLRRQGAVVSDLGIIRDKVDELSPRLRAAARDHDLILTSGGVSTGEEDHVKAAVEASGSLMFWRLAIKPGRPVALGVIDGTPFVGLPGNPVAVYVTFSFVARPIVELLSGAAATQPSSRPVRADFSYRKKAGRREYVRVSLEAVKDGLPVARKHPREGAGMLSSLTGTDGLVELPEDGLAVQPGDEVAFYPYAGLY
jgi:molybdopterin molybdotransferase